MSFFFQQHLLSVTGTTVSTQTIWKWLHDVRMYACRLITYVMLTPGYHVSRRKWTTEYVNWSKNEWRNILFPEQSHFFVYVDNGHIFIWRKRGVRNNPALVQWSVRFGDARVVVNASFVVKSAPNPIWLEFELWPISDIDIRPSDPL